MQNKRPVISKCAKELGIATDDVRSAFQSLVEGYFSFIFTKFMFVIYCLILNNL